MRVSVLLAASLSWAAATASRCKPSSAYSLPSYSSSSSVPSSSASPPSSVSSSTSASSSVSSSFYSLPSYPSSSSSVSSSASSSPPIIPSSSVSSSSASSSPSVASSSSSIASPSASPSTVCTNVVSNPNFGSNFAGWSASIFPVLSIDNCYLTDSCMRLDLPANTVATVSQSLATVAGVRYYVSFAYRINVGGADQPSIQWSANGVSASTSTQDLNNWQVYKNSGTYFTATQGTTQFTLTFSTTTPGTAEYDITDVTVSNCPPY